MAKAVLFDLDGVLVDSAPYHFQAWRELFRQVGREYGEKEFGETFGLRNDAILRYMLGERPREEMARLAVGKEELFRAQIGGRIEAGAGASELVGRLKAAGLALAIVTSTPRANVELILGALGLDDAFPVIVAEEDVRRGKPDPEGFLRAAQRLGVPPVECVVLEDAPEGIEAAKAAGMRCVGVATSRSVEALGQADLVVERLDDERLGEFLLS